MSSCARMPSGPVFRTRWSLAMAESDSRTQIVIACISLVGVLAAAVIANWSRISGGNASPPATAAEGAVQPQPEPAGRGISPRRVAPRPDQVVVGANADGPDSVVVLSAVPPLGSAHQTGAAHRLQHHDSLPAHHLAAEPRSPVSNSISTTGRLTALARTTCRRRSTFPCSRAITTSGSHFRMSWAWAKAMYRRGRYDLGRPSGVTFPAASSSRHLNSRVTVIRSNNGYVE